MAATTENTDGSGAVLIHVIQDLSLDLEKLTARFNVLAEAFDALQPCPEFPTSDLIFFGTGPARVEIVTHTDPSELQFRINHLIQLIESEGCTVESVQPVSSVDILGVFIVSRLPLAETEAAQ